MGISFSAEVGIHHFYGDYDHRDVLASFELGNWRVLRSLIQNEDCVGQKQLTYVGLLNWLHNAFMEKGIQFITWDSCLKLAEALDVDAREDETGTDRMFVTVKWG